VSSDSLKLLRELEGSQPPHSPFLCSVVHGVGASLNETLVAVVEASLLSRKDSRKTVGYRQLRRELRN
jgi:hypothetical protein